MNLNALCAILTSKEGLKMNCFFTIGDKTRCGLNSFVNNLN